MRRVGELVEASAEPVPQLALERRAVERLRFFRRDPVGGAALDELALHAEYRRRLLVPANQRVELVLDAEQLGEKALEVGCERQDQRRLVLGGQRRGIGARGLQPVTQRRVRRAERIDKGAVERDQAVAPVQVDEFDAEAERECGTIRAAGRGDGCVQSLPYNARRAMRRRTASMSSPRSSFRA